MPGATDRGEGARRSLGAAWLLALALLAVGVVGSLSPWRAALADPARRVTSDFQILHAAGRGLVEGRQAYDPAVLDEIGRRDGRPQTPFCAANPLVVRTFGLLADRDLDAAYGLALSVNIGLGLLAMVLLASCLRAAGTSSISAWAVALAAMGLGMGTWMSLAMNSTNLFALAALCAALRCGLAGREGLEGVCLGLAVVAKTSPALLLLVIALSGRRKPLTGGVLTLGVVGALSVLWSGWGVHAQWFHEVLPLLGYAPELGPGRFNNSLHVWNIAPNGLFSRSLFEAQAPLLLARLLAWAVSGLVLWQLWAALSGAGSRRREPAALLKTYALGISAMLLVSSVTWPHHLLLLAVPAAALMTLGTEYGRVGQRVGLLCCLVLYMPLGSLDEGAQLTLESPLRSGALVVLFGLLAHRRAESVAP